MNKAEANKEAEKIYDQWCKDQDEIKRKAQENGTWSKYGLDSNNHLFKELNNEVKEKLKALAAMIDED